MKKQLFKFKHSTTCIYPNATFSDLKKIIPLDTCIFITDENVFKFHKQKFKGYNTIVLKAGEEYKIQATVDTIIEQLIAFEADRTTTLIGVGGGVITDITGYVAAIYMRGINVAFVPTSLLCMVDACIGGKNGIDVGNYKNLVGTVKQPSFILYDFSFLSSLPLAAWQNGFAEMIKHACIADERMFNELKKNKIKYYLNNVQLIAQLVQRNVKLKMQFVQKDEFEKNIRRQLNFGHTIGHPLETLYELAHGQAISIGMQYAARISHELLGFGKVHDVVQLLEQYGLPTSASFNTKKVLAVMKMDKKKQEGDIHFILLEKIGKAIVLPIPFKDFEKLFYSLPVK